MSKMNERHLVEHPPRRRVCPNCQAHSQADWIGITHEPEPAYEEEQWELVSLDQPIAAMLGYCFACSSVSFHDRMGDLLWPERLTAPSAAHEMPNELKEIYEEARSISSRSPRAAAALLRLCAEQLCGANGLSGNFWNMISELKNRGGSRRLIRALDAVRIIGNDAAHAGEIHLDDNEEQVGVLFVLLNLIVDEFYAQDALVDAVYERLPDSKKIDKDRL